MTYYSSLMALTLYFLIVSFSAELPWSKCREEWGQYCINSGHKVNNSDSTFDTVPGTANAFDLLSDEQYRSSAEYYFT